MATGVQLGFVGAGNMATALCRGIRSAGLLQPEQMVASDPDEGRRKLFEAATGVATTPDNAEVFRAEAVVLAVKPQVLPAVLEEVGPLLTRDTLVISIAAGIPTARIEAATSEPVRVIRAMPNTPMLVGEGAAALCKGSHATDDDMARAKRLFASCAAVFEVPEYLIHAVTALSGSGPAYAFYLAELMARAGAEMGLAEEDAVALANKTLLGAARMLAETAEPAAELRKKVTSPGGTTEAALRSMRQDGVAEAIIKAIHTACARSKELGSAPK